MDWQQSRGTTEPGFGKPAGPRGCASFSEQAVDSLDENKVDVVPICDLPAGARSGFPSHSAPRETRFGRGLLGSSKDRWVQLLSRTSAVQHGGASAGARGALAGLDQEPLGSGDLAMEVPRIELDAPHHFVDRPQLPHRELRRTKSRCQR